jgi:hypothetical protein
MGYVAGQREITHHRAVTKRTSSIRRITSTQEEWLREPVEQLTHRNDGDTRGRFETVDGSALLTDLQRAALRWLSFFD